MSLDLDIQPLLNMDDLRACEGLQREVWGLGDVEIVPAAQMRAALHAGALVAGAFVGGALVGFLYGFPAFAHEPGLAPLGMHSHMLAVRPEARGLGLGRRLKWFQRRWCLQRGITWMTWTFDPLQARNARLNIEHLGARVHEYQVDFYGLLGGDLAGGLPTDRFLALWALDDPWVAGRAAADPFAASERLPGDVPQARPAARPAEGVWALAAAAEDRPGPLRLGVAAPWVWVAAPRDINRWRLQEAPVALAWTEAMRAVSLDLVHRGYQVATFREGAYGWFPRKEIIK